MPNRFRPTPDGARALAAIVVCAIVGLALWAGLAALASLILHLL